MNPPIEVCKSNNHGVAIMKPDEKSIIGIFLSQLRLLLGIPEVVKINFYIYLIIFWSQRYKEKIFNKKKITMYILK